MADVSVQSNAQAVAELAASMTIADLSNALARYGNATWVLAGGSTPLATYRLIAEEYQDKVDWANVHIVSGDERCVPKDDPESNWYQNNRALIQQLPIPVDNLLRPRGELTAEQAAGDYQRSLAKLPKTETGEPRFDQVWLGLGEDGHTLSLFPDNPALKITNKLVIPVHNSPKLPANRISLSISALQNSSNCLILATGSTKAAIVARALAGDKSLPIVQVAMAIETQGGHVTWLIDMPAAEHLA